LLRPQLASYFDHVFERRVQVDDNCCSPSEAALGGPALPSTFVTLVKEIAEIVKNGER
jgi:hypothetical protein